MQPKATQQSLLGPFARAQYPQDTVRSLRPTHSYKGEVTEASENLAQNCATSVIDGAIQVQSVDAKTRSYAQHHFSTLCEQASRAKESKKTEQWGAILKTTLGVLATGAAALALHIGRLTMPQGTMLAVFGIAATIFGARQSYVNRRQLNQIQQDIGTLKNEKEKWEDPLTQAIAQRRKAGSEGFYYVYKQDLKEKVVHAEEVSALWTRDLEKLLSSSNDLPQVMEENLLGGTQTAYAWKEGFPQELQLREGSLSASMLSLLADKYRELRERYQAFQSHIATELNAVDASHQMLKEQISCLRNRWMVPANNMYRQGIAQADYLYNQAMESFIRERDRAIREVENAFHYEVRNCLDLEQIQYKQELDRLCANHREQINQKFNTHPLVLLLKQAYARDKRMCSLLHTQTELHVNAFFDNSKRQLALLADQCRQQIENQRARGINQLSAELNTILHTKSEESLRRHLVNSPLLNREWSLPSHQPEPSWYEVYGQQPLFQTQFAADISQRAWNLFWGQEGIGCYAHSPSDSWMNFMTQGSAFPLKHDWFHLHEISHTYPISVDFSQPLHIPPPPQSEKSTQERKVAFGGTTRR